MSRSYHSTQICQLTIKLLKLLKYSIAIYIASRNLNQLLNYFENLNMHIFSTGGDYYEYILY